MSGAILRSPSLNVGVKIDVVMPALFVLNPKIMFVSGFILKVTIVVASEVSPRTLSKFGSRWNDKFILLE
jgi:hypothetical protein